MRRRSARTILLSAVLGAGLVGFGGTAYAQEDPADPSTSESTSAPADTSTSVSETAPAPGGDDAGKDEPPFVEVPIFFSPTVSTGSACEAGVGFVDVVLTNLNDVAFTYAVSLSKAGVSAGDKDITVAAGATQTVTFEKVAAGDYDVLVRNDGQVVAQSATSVDRCGEITEPVDDPLQVFVRCENGEGLVTIRVFNLEGEAKTFTVSVDDLELPGDIELGTGEYTVVVDEAKAPDGSYAVRVVAEGIDHSETVKVACAPAPSNPPATSTTAPVPQPRPAANDGGLASTGAAVTGMALLAGLALALGGGLVIASRRRRTAQSDGSES